MTDDRKLPILKPQEMVRVVEKMGFFRTKKSKGGHLRYAIQTAEGQASLCIRVKISDAAYSVKF